MHEEAPGEQVRGSAMSRMLRAIGLMSGTSLDGIDVALIDTDGEERVVRGASATFAYGSDFRARLAAALDDARGLTDRNARPGCLADVERELTERHAAAVEKFLAEQQIAPDAVDVAGFHGQTVLHKVSLAKSIVVGEP